jgi:hypothetical protein
LQLTYEAENMVYIPPNYPTTGPNPVGGSGSIDNDPQFIQLVDAAWEAVLQFQTSPNDLNTQTAMQCITNLDKFLSAQSPISQGTSPEAYAIQQALDSGSSLSPSVASICADYNGTNWTEAVSTLQAKPQELTDLLIPFDAVGSVRADQSNTQVQTDITLLIDDLKEYNASQGKSTVYLTRIAQDIEQLNSDAAHVSDGYLTMILTYINTFTTPGGSDTLLSLSNAVTEVPQPSDALANLAAALTGVGEGTSTGGTMLAFLTAAYLEEYQENP